MAEGARGALKELGDVQNWAELLERDILVLEDCVRRGEEEEKEEAGRERRRGKRY